MNNSKERKRKIILGRVKELRTNQSVNLTQEKFAERIGVSSNTISRIECKNMSLSSEIALNIADEFDVSLDWLFMRSEEKDSPKLIAKKTEAYNFIIDSISYNEEDEKQQKN